LLKREEKERETGKINSIVGPGTKFNGECDVDGTIRIDGEFEGKLNVGKIVIIGKSGVVKGDVKSGEVVIGGKVIGTVAGENKVELQAGAHIEGDIRTKSLIVDEGVFFHGECKMKEEGTSSIKVIDKEDIKDRKINT
jgi:cytoskeletal protein CcmA (bactofilin family)